MPVGVHRTAWGSKNEVKLAPTIVEPSALTPYARPWVWPGSVPRSVGSPPAFQRIGRKKALPGQQAPR